MKRSSVSSTSLVNHRAVSRSPRPFRIIWQEDDAMRRLLSSFLLIPVLVPAAAGAARADVCVAVDEAHDTLSPANRAAAVLLIGRQFEAAGERIAPDGCANRYAVSHIMLGNTIIVSMAGPLGQREGHALGIDDLPALYSQMVRSLVTGRPMTGFNVVDRTNVTAAQSATERVHGDSLWYARLGYGSVFGDRAYGGPAIGFGYRYELDSFGVDVSFLNFQKRASNDYTYYGPYQTSSDAFAGSLLKLEGLYFLRPKANATAYVGGGFSWGGVSFGSGWDGSGLQGELTAGYELPRASTLRTFVQLDAALPFYQTSTIRYPVNYRGVGPVTTEHRYTPTVAVSFGVGWQRDRRGRR
jgi:hypothetical protein